MFPVRIIEIYWSAVARFRNKPEATVAATVLASLCVKRTNIRVMLPNMPQAVMAPPRHMAQRISHTVSIIPPIPRVAISSVNAGVEACNDVLPDKANKTPLYKASPPLTPSPATSRSTSVWKTSMHTTAKAVDMNKVIIEDTLRAINIPVTTGTSNTQKVI